MNGLDKGLNFIAVELSTDITLGIDLKTSPVGDWIEWHTSVLRGEDRGSIITLTPQELAQVISIMKTVHDTLPVTHIP